DQWHHRQYFWRALPGDAGWLRILFAPGRQFPRGVAGRLPLYAAGQLRYGMDDHDCAGRLRRADQPSHQRKGDRPAAAGSGIRRHRMQAWIQKMLWAALLAAVLSLAFMAYLRPAFML